MHQNNIKFILIPFLLMYRLETNHSQNQCLRFPHDFNDMFSVNCALCSVFCGGWVIFSTMTMSNTMTQLSQTQQTSIKNNNNLCSVICALCSLFCTLCSVFLCFSFCAQYFVFCFFCTVYLCLFVICDLCSVSSIKDSLNLSLSSALAN